MKSDYKAALSCLIVLMLLVGIFFFLDKGVSLPMVSVNTDTATNYRYTSDSAYYNGYGKGKSWNNSGYRDYKGYRRGNGSSASHQAPYSSYEASKPSRFAFNPNTADSTTLLSLGLPPWMVRGMYKYRAKGGVYRTPEDFARIPGLTQQQYLELKPYLVFGDEARMAADIVGPKRYETSDRPQRDTMAYPQKLQPGQYISVNTSDTTQLKKIPGVGSYYAKRIADYRTRLGGFVSLEQLREIQGLPEGAADYLNVGEPVKKLAINKLSLNQLRSHPYIGYYRAKSITDYRRLKGNITSLQQLRLLPNFTEEDIRKLEPYIEY